jgi:hypothetical protein
MPHGMNKIANHGDSAATAIYAASGGEPSVYFRANLDVNTDGASRSYHPGDPRGKSLALNNMGNALTGMWNAAGERIDCSPRQGACYTLWIETFIAARDADYNPNGQAVTPPPSQPKNHFPTQCQMG